MKFNQKKIDVSTIVINRGEKRTGNIVFHFILYTIAFSILAFLWYESPDKINRRQILESFTNPVERKNILDEFILVFNEHKETSQFSASSLSLWEKSPPAQKNKQQSISLKMNSGDSITLSPFLFTAEDSSRLVNTHKYTGTYITRCGIKKDTYAIVSNCIFTPIIKENQQQDKEHSFKVHSRITYIGNEPTLTDIHFLSKDIDSRLKNANPHYFLDIVMHLIKLFSTFILSTYILFGPISKIIAKKIFRGILYLFKNKLNRNYEKLPTVKIKILKKRI